MITWAQQVRHWRTTLNLTQSEFAYLDGMWITPQTISDWECGRRAPRPSAKDRVTRAVAREIHNRNYLTFV